MFSNFSTKLDIWYIECINFFLKIQTICISNVHNYVDWMYPMYLDFYRNAESLQMSTIFWNIYRQFVHLLYPIFIQIFFKSWESVHLMYITFCWIYKIIYIQCMQCIQFFFFFLQNHTIFTSLVHNISLNLYNSLHSMYILYSIFSKKPNNLYI